MTSTFRKVIDPAHMRMARMLGYCLTLDTSHGWQGFTALACAKLTERARVSLAWAVLSGLGRDQAVAVAESVLGGAGAPIPALLDDAEEAAFWADMATDSELRAYAWAAFSRLSPKDRADFLDLATRRAAA